MDNYKAFLFELPDEITEDIFTAFLSEAGFEGFHYNDLQLIAYIPEDSLDPVLFEDTIMQLNKICDFTWSSKVVENENWNKIWESKYEPVIVDEDTVIRAPFHEEFSDKKFRITLSPKMSFGTGHHPSTRLMMKMMRKYPFESKKVLDAGCGTCVLGIFAEMLGAEHILAFDNFIYAYQNSLENVEINNCSRVEVKHLELTEWDETDTTYDIVLANINRNVIMENMARFGNLLRDDSLIIFSGIMEKDADTIKDACLKNHFEFKDEMKEAGWVSLTYTKQTK